MTCGLQLTFPFFPSGCATLTARGAAAEQILQLLGECHQLQTTPIQAPGSNNCQPVIQLSENPPEDTVNWETYPGKCTLPNLLWRWQPKTFRQHLQISQFPIPEHIPFLLRRLSHFTMLAQVRATHALLLHGALLFSPIREKAWILFGESGIGKSTACRRFLSQGGKPISDDKMLLSPQPDGSWLAQPLPTWSAYGIRNISVPFSTPVPVLGILNLLRGEQDKIQPADFRQWKIGITSSLGNALIYPNKWLPLPVIQSLLFHELDEVPHLQNSFGLWCVQGDLQGTLFQNLHDWQPPRP